MYRVEPSSLVANRPSVVVSWLFCSRGPVDVRGGGGGGLLMELPGGE